MPAYKLKIIKRPLKESIPDVQPNFPKLDNLHLELLENKKKIKSGLPLIPIRRTVVKPAVSPKPEPVEPPKIIPNDKQSPTQSTKIEDDFLKELGLESSDHEHQETTPDPPPETPATEESYPEEIPDEEMPSEEDDRQEYLIKLKILKKANPTFEFPHYTEHTDLHTLQKIYKDSVKLINLEKNVDSYRVWLMAGFLGIELLACKAGLDFKGFSKFQFKKMEKYESMLVELGEKSYSNFAANWPVEIRLLGVIILDACIFYLGKLVSDYAGEGVADIFGMLFGMPTGKANREKKKKMRGPSIKPEDIRNMNKKD